MSAELKSSESQVEYPHSVTRTNKVLAVASGALIGAGVVFPLAVGPGLVIGAIGAARENAHKRDLELQGLDSYIKDAFSNIKPEELDRL